MAKDPVNVFLTCRDLGPWDRKVHRLLPASLESLSLSALPQELGSLCRRVESATVRSARTGELLLSHLGEEWRDVAVKPS